MIGQASPFPSRQSLALVIPLHTTGVRVGPSSESYPTELAEHGEERGLLYSTFHDGITELNVIFKISRHRTLRLRKQMQCWAMQIGTTRRRIRSAKHILPSSRVERR